MTALEKAARLRNDPDKHYNCAQAVLMSFAEEAGLPPEQAESLCAHFGAGMRMKATCGAVTGGLMALGLLGKDAQTAQAFTRAFQESEGELSCGALVERKQEKGLMRKEGCDALVLKAVELVEALK